MPDTPEQITETVSTGDAWQYEDGKLVEKKDREESAPLTVDLTKEYVAGGPWYYLPPFLRTLPFAIDDITKDFGDDLYDRMLMDGQVASDVQTFKLAVLADGIQVVPAVKDKVTDPKTGRRSENPEFEKAKEVADFCERQMDGCQHAFDPDSSNALYWSFFNLLDGAAYGNKIAEKLCEIAKAGPDKGRLVLKALKVKPRRNASFVVDAYMNVVGIIGRVPGSGLVIPPQSLYSDPASVPNFLLRRKFAIFTYNPKDSDPRGTSILRPAYDPWFVKQQIKQERLKYAARFLGGFVVGEVGPEQNPQPATNPDGSYQYDENGQLIQVYPEQTLATALTALGNGSVIAVPNGSKVTITFPPSATPYEAMLDRQDREISQAILGQTRATKEAEHGSRADSQTGQDILGLRIGHGKRALAEMIRFDILRDLVVANFGDEGLQYLPQVLCAKAEQQDKANLWNAAANLKRAAYFAPSQMMEVDAELGLPVRTEEEAAQVNQAPATPGTEPDGDEASDAEKKPAQESA